jgi:hypothetical protein
MEGKPNDGYFGGMKIAYPKKWLLPEHFVINRKYLYTQPYPR